MRDLGRFGSRVLSAIEEGGETSLAVDQRQRQQVLTFEVKQVEHEIDEVGAAPPFRGVLDQRKRGDAVRPHTAELAVKIGLPRRQRAQGYGERRIFAGPVEPRAGQQADVAAVEPSVHAIAVAPVDPVPTPTQSDRPAEEIIEVELPSAIKLRLTGAVDEVALRRVLSVLS
jgi:hypothetical protein